MSVFKTKLAQECFDNLMLHASPQDGKDRYDAIAKAWEVASNIEIEMMKIQVEHARINLQYQPDKETQNDQSV